jgi:hypothetical protein
MFFAMRNWLNAKNTPKRQQLMRQQKPIQE